MEFIPETVEALDELDALIDDTGLAVRLRAAADEAERVAPHLAGISIATREHDITFTLVSTDAVTAVLDGVQYVSSGPCVEAIDLGQGMATTVEDMFDEPRWHALARASAASGVRSTLTLPIVDDGQVVGTINLYGQTIDAFDGKHQRLAHVFGGWAAGAVTNADLGFSTRASAEQAPHQLRENAVVDTAAGIVAASYDLSVEAARENIVSAAARAGVPVARLARLVVDVFDPGTT